MKIKKFVNRTWNFIKKHRWSLLLVMVSLGVGGFFVWDSYTAGTPFVDMGIVIPERKPVTVTAPLSGREITEEQAARRPIAVVVENHSQARPQSGLNDADFVFETTAEGGITRFLAIYHSIDPKQIGPVRSARNYFVEWADSFNALFAHAGGSDEALALIRQMKIDDLNQFAFGSYYWRDRTRVAPHNLYTTLQKLRDAAASRGYKTKDVAIEAYHFKDDLDMEQRPAAHKFRVNFNATYAPTYTYNPTTNSYDRSILGVKQTDANSGATVSAKNVVIAFSNLTTQIIRGNGYTVIDTTDKGTAYFYRDGAMTTGTWSRTAGDQIKFYDAAGKSFEFNKGTTWVDFVAKGTAVQ